MDVVPRPAPAAGNVVKSHAKAAKAAGDGGTTDADLERLLARVQDVCDALKSRPAQWSTITPGDVKTLVTESCAAYSALVAKGPQNSQPRDADNVDADADDSSPQRLDNAMQVLYYLEQAISASAIAARLAAAGLDAANTNVNRDELAAGLAPFCKMELENDVNKFQQLLLYLLNSLQHRGYRRYGTDCYEQLYTAEGHNTHAWVPACAIKDFVYAAARKETNFDQWLNMTQAKGNAVCAAEYLTSCRDVQFPVLVKNRGIFSFRNGLYDAPNDRFYAYRDGGVPGDLVAAKYFDLEFDEAPVDQDAWSSIETKNFQGILDFQEFPEDVCRWMYVMIGRLLYDLNDKDRWQVIPYLKGQASSGKSTILLRVCRNLYDKADVGVLSNNIEKVRPGGKPPDPPPHAYHLRL